MRKIYNGKTIYSNLTQGSVINHCVGSDYEGCEVFGCIITPRCDMGNGLKVPTVHYLPIVSLKDWYNKFGLLRLLKLHHNNSKDKFNAAINNNLGIRKFTEYKLSFDEMESYIINKSDGNKRDNLLTSLKEYKNAINVDVISYKPTEKEKSALIKSLLAYQLPGYYPIENWVTEGEATGFQVILLRDIKVINRDIAIKLNYGFIEEDFDEEYLKSNAMTTTIDKSNIYEIVSEIASPYIEHIMQAFSHNFCRIGVEDMQNNVIEDLARTI